MILRYLYTEAYADLNDFEKMVLRLYNKHNGNSQKILDSVKQNTDSPADHKAVSAAIQKLIDSGLAKPSVVTVPKDTLTASVTPSGVVTIDKSIPRVYRAGNITVDVHKALRIHEKTEMASIDAGKSQPDAHIDGLRAEHAYVSSQGADPAAYEAFLKPYEEKLEKLSTSGNPPIDARQKVALNNDVVSVAPEEELSQSQISQLGAMADAGYSQDEIAAALKCTAGTVVKTMNDRSYLIPGDYKRRVDGRARSIKAGERSIRAGERSIRAANFHDSPAGKAYADARKYVDAQKGNEQKGGWYEWLKQFPASKQKGIIAKTVASYGHSRDKTLGIIAATLIKAGLAGDKNDPNARNKLHTDASGLLKWVERGASGDTLGWPSF